ncbi:FecR domain-containing protein [uncultured Cyclobacterium sp.]|uniref:FecR family protein n=1 Tax=uncultured Cyclobacterium sp. TaxID=453820 RepID=UPI0030EF4CB3
MSKEKDNIDLLLVKVLTGTASEAESDEVKTWAKENAVNSNTLKKLKEIWKEKSATYSHVNSEENIDAIWNKGIEKKKSSKFFRNTYLNYAASLLVILTLFTAFYYFIQIIEDENNTKELIYTVRENPPGKKTKLSLPDGSVVFLNCSSSIKYIKGFEGEERRVQLNGEAYFKVASNPNKPFIVESKGLITKALGTIFNIKAYPNCELTSISLLEGEVEIQNVGKEKESILLLPGKQLQVDITNNTFNEIPFDSNLVVALKEGKLVLKNSDFDTVMLNLERWFGVNISVLGKKPSNWRVTTVYKGQTLKNILMDLQYSKKFTYEINDDQIIIEF